MVEFVVGVKRDFTAQEGWAWRGSRAAGGGLVVEEWVRVGVGNALGGLIGWILLARMDLRRCLCSMAQRCWWTNWLRCEMF